MNNHIYIDGANLHRGSIELGFELDYKNLHSWLRQKYGATKIYLFIGLISKYTKLYEHLQECGYILIFKETSTNMSGETKGNCDAELVLKVVSDYYEKSFTSCVIISGDGDFACVVDFLNERKSITCTIAPNKKKCSFLLRRIQVPIVYLDEHYQKFSSIIPQKEKAPNEGVPS